MICGDVCEADFADGTIYFFYNPFGVDTMREVLRNIRASLDYCARQIKIVYYNAIYESELRELDWLEKYDICDAQGAGGIVLAVQAPLGCNDALTTDRGSNAYRRTQKACKAFVE